MDIFNNRVLGWIHSRQVFGVMVPAPIATARWLLAHVWPTVPGARVSGRALTRYERLHF